MTVIVVIVIGSVFLGWLWRPLVTREYLLWRLHRIHAQLKTLPPESAERHALEQRIERIREQIADED